MSEPRRLNSPGSRDREREEERGGGKVGEEREVGERKLGVDRWR